MVSKFSVRARIVKFVLGREVGFCLSCSFKFFSKAGLVFRTAVCSSSKLRQSSDLCLASDCSFSRINLSLIWVRSASSVGWVQVALSGGGDPGEGGESGSVGGGVVVLRR